jgi:hypothetical protein
MGSDRILIADRSCEYRGLMVEDDGKYGRKFYPEERCKLMSTWVKVWGKTRRKD